MPNNPTGNCFSRSVVQEIVENFQGIVCIDEAYFDFSEGSFLDLLSEHPNLKALTVTPDAAIGRGGCVLETPSGDVDATIETQLKRIYQSLSEAFMG